MAGSFYLLGQKAFENIATAKISASAMDAKANGYLAESDKIVMNRAQLLGEAKSFALALANTYTQQKPEKVWASGGEAYGALMLGIEGFKEGKYASEYDAIIAREVADILTAGGLTEPQWVSQDMLLAFERKAFIKLIMQEKTQERIMYMLANNKPLRN